MNIDFEKLWHPERLRRYDLMGPRYTSYPTAPQFDESFNDVNWLAAITASNASGRPLSLYFHIPFCDTVCYYCACNKVITANKSRSEPYVDALLDELRMQASYVDLTREVRQLHWGGGTPTYLSDSQMHTLMKATRETFDFASDEAGEFSIEIHPKTVDASRIKTLRSLGFNRLSIGVQDFDPAVQTAVNRFNSEEEVQELIYAARAQGFKSISVDLIYGLPKQSATTFAKTLEAILKIRPDRISIFNYAHLPHIFKVQKQIDSRFLPEPQEKLKILGQSIQSLVKENYVYIGMDHFALPEDELSIAQKKGRLQRNFQGYSTHGDSDLLGFGVSSISAIANCFVQNEKTIEAYQNSISEGRRPISKGLALSMDDKIRQYVISQLICQFEVHFEDVNARFNIDFHDYFSKSLVQLQEFIDDGLVGIDENSIAITPEGRLLVRRICMAFDAYLSVETIPTSQYSRIV